MACSIDEVTPLIEHLRHNRPVSQPMAFPRGTVLPDGRLDLCKQSLGPQGCRLVTESLRNHQHIRSVLLGTDGIGDEGAADIGELVKANSSLEVVYMGCNGITQRGVESLVEALSNNTSIEGLWLKRNPIGDEGAVSIAKLLQQNHKLRVLDLVNTGIGYPGIQTLCRSLKIADCSIERLYLGGNAIDAASAVEIAEVLDMNQTLRALHLNVGAIGDEGAIAIARGLRDNRTLYELGLASNGITTSGAQPLLEAVTVHPSLINLDLGYSPSTKVLQAQPNSLGDDGALLVARMLRHNSTLMRINLAKTGINKIGREAIEHAILGNRTLRDCVLDGGLSEAVRVHLSDNRNKCSHTSLSPRDTALIRSVYRTAK